VARHADGLEVEPVLALVAEVVVVCRAVTAADLSAVHPEVDDSVTAAQFVGRVNAALATGDRETILILAGDLDRRDHAGCPDAKTLVLQT
jgi:hypothetical protein